MNYLNSVVAGGGVAGDAGLQLNNVEILYTKVQRVYVKPQHKEERQRELRVNVEIHAGLSPVCRKVCLEHKFHKNTKISMRKKSVRLTKRQRVFNLVNFSHKIIFAPKFTEFVRPSLRR